jgi:TPR repeat protein
MGESLMQYPLASPTDRLDFARAANIVGDYDHSFAITSEIATTNNPKALNNLALHYALGRGIEKNTDTALALFEKSAEGGFAAAHHNLGVTLHKKNGRKLTADALSHFSIAANAGFAKSQSAMGDFYVNGASDLLPQSPTMAAAWYNTPRKKEMPLRLIGCFGFARAASWAMTMTAVNH